MNEATWPGAVLRAVSPPNPYGDDRPAVWSEAPAPQVDYVIVGEAPGRWEVRQGKPFVGPSGQLLREIVSEVGLGVVHYCNASLWRPGGPTGPDEPPTVNVLNLERPRLMLEIALVNPRRAVIAVGATAARAILGDVPRFRGMVREVGWYGRTFLVYVTHHPAYVLRDPDAYVDLVTDLQRAKALEVPQRFSPGQPHYLLLDRPAELSGSIVAIDTEYDQFGQLTAFALADGERVFVGGPEQLPQLVETLAQYRGTLVGHNIEVDRRVLPPGIRQLENAEDTILLHYSQDERRGSHKLKVLGPVVAKMDTAIDLIWPYTHKGGLGERQVSNDEDEEFGWGAVPPETLREYCGRDAEVTRAVYVALKKTQDSRTERVYTFLKRAARAFAHSPGITVDQQALQDAISMYEEKVAQHLRDFDFNPNSPRAVLAALREAGYTNIRTTSREALVGLEGELPEKLLKYREDAKLLKGFLYPLREWSQREGVVKPHYKLHGTESGRTSCADPNLQQVPSSLKHLFVARPGHVFVSWDFKTHEVRGIAYLSRDEQLLRILQDEDADPHQVVSDLAGLGDRQVAKRAVFAVAYGAGITRLVRTGIPRPQAVRAYEAVGQLFPGLARWRESVVRQMYDEGYIETPYGRRRHFWYIDERNAAHLERVAVNFGPQSLCGDIALDSAVTVFEELGYPPMIFVHDFNLIEVPERKAEKVRRWAEEIARNIFPNPYVKFVPEMKPLSGHW